MRLPTTRAVSGAGAGRTGWDISKAGQLLQPTADGAGLAEGGLKGLALIPTALVRLSGRRLAARDASAIAHRQAAAAAAAGKVTGRNGHLVDVTAPAERP